MEPCECVGALAAAQKSEHWGSTRMGLAFQGQLCLLSPLKQLSMLRFCCWFFFSPYSTLGAIKISGNICALCLQI